MAERFPVHIVDDDAGLRNSLRFMLTNSGRIVHTYDCGESFLAEIGRLEQGPVLLDIRLGGRDGFGVLQELARQGGNLPVIFLTGHGDIPMAVKAMRAGAIDFLTKPCARGDMLAVLDRADEMLKAADAGERHRIKARERLDVLSRREIQVLNELARGLPNKSIASDLEISPRTVEVHRANVMHKLGAKNFPDALRIAFSAGMPFDLPDMNEPELPMEQDRDQFQQPASPVIRTGNDD